MHLTPALNADLLTNSRWDLVSYNNDYNTPYRPDNSVYTDKK